MDAVLYDKTNSKVLSRCIPAEYAVSLKKGEIIEFNNIKYCVISVNKNINKTSFGRTIDIKVNVKRV